MRDLADDCLDGLAEVARLEAGTAALKVRLAAEYARATEATAPPAASPHDAKCQEMAVTAEVACVLTVSERAAADTDNPGWPEPLDESVLDQFPLQDT